jgi:hypothetical protein
LQKNSPFIYFRHVCDGTAFGTENQPTIICYQGIVKSNAEERNEIAFGCPVNFVGTVLSDLDVSQYHQPVLAGIVTKGKHRVLLLSHRHKQKSKMSFGSSLILNSNCKFKWEHQSPEAVSAKQPLVDTAWRILLMFKKGYEASEHNIIPERVGYSPADESKEVLPPKRVSRSRGHKASKKGVPVPKPKAVTSTGGSKKRKARGSASQEDMLPTRKKTKGVELLDEQPNSLQLITSSHAGRLAPATRSYDNIVKLKLLNRHDEVTRERITQENLELKLELEKLRAEKALRKEQEREKIRLIEERDSMLREKDEDYKGKLRQKDEEIERMTKEQQQQKLDKMEQNIQSLKSEMLASKTNAVLQTELRYLKLLRDTEREGDKEKRELLAGSKDEICEVLKKKSDDDHALLMAVISPGTTISHGQFPQNVQRGFKRSYFRQPLAIDDKKRKKKRRYKKKNGKQRATGGCARCNSGEHGTIYCPEQKSIPLMMNHEDPSSPGDECDRCLQPGHAPSHCPAPRSVPLQQLQKQQLLQNQQRQMIPISASGKNAYTNLAGSSSSDGDASSSE